MPLVIRTCENENHAKKDSLAIALVATDSESKKILERVITNILAEVGKEAKVTIRDRRKHRAAKEKTGEETETE